MTKNQKKRILESLNDEKRQRLTQRYMSDEPIKKIIEDEGLHINTGDIRGIIMPLDSLDNICPYCDKPMKYVPSRACKPTYIPRDFFVNRVIM